MGLFMPSGVSRSLFIELGEGEGPEDTDPGHVCRDAAARGSLGESQTYTGLLKSSKDRRAHQQDRHQRHRASHGPGGGDRRVPRAAAAESPSLRGRRAEKVGSAPP